MPEKSVNYNLTGGGGADESTEILGKGRKIKPAEESLRWIGSS